MKQKCMIILGMHRSGTSSLTGILEKAGVYLGKVFTSNPFNLKGNRENARIMELHNDLLEYNKSAWDNPPFSSLLWPEHSKKERDNILLDYKNIPLWGFKDPRTLLTLDGWLEVLPNVSFAAIFRHPVSVMESLRSRNKNFSIEKCYFLILYFTMGAQFKNFQKTMLNFTEKILLKRRALVRS